MKKNKRKIQTGIVIGIFSVIIIACLISIFSQVFTEYKENESFKNLAEIVTEESTGNDTEKEQFINPNLLKVVILIMKFRLNKQCITRPITNLIQYQNSFQ